VRKDLACVGLTEHPLGSAHRLIVAINYSPVPVRPSFVFANGWKFGKALRGPAPSPAVAIPANDAVIFTVTA
jgi:hypothetical protein